LSCVPQAGAGSFAPQAGAGSFVPQAGAGSFAPQAGAGSFVPQAEEINSFAVISVYLQIDFPDPIGKLIITRKFSFVNPFIVYFRGNKKITHI
jgi:hypothetical protein